MAADLRSHNVLNPGPLQVADRRPPHVVQKWLREPHPFARLSPAEQMVVYRKAALAMENVGVFSGSLLLPEQPSLHISSDRQVGSMARDGKLLIRNCSKFNHARP
jgi:hypothetical protein